jgi:general secretion pathway protein G
VSTRVLSTLYVWLIWILGIACLGTFIGRIRGPYELPWPSEIGAVLALGFCAVAYRELYWLRKTGHRSFAITVPVVLAAGAFVFYVGLITSMCRVRRSDRARMDLQAIGAILEAHHAKKGSYPPNGDGLATLVVTGELERLPMDPWDRRYGYAVKEGKPFVWTLGEDGKPGGRGEDTDVGDPPYTRSTGEADP